MSEHQDDCHEGSAQLQLLTQMRDALDKLEELIDLAEQENRQFQQHCRTQEQDSCGRQS